MAEKEKRILIDVINPGINCVYRLDNDPKGQSLCKHNGNMEPVTAKECRHCEEGMTRQEAIDKISRALFKHEAPSHMIYENMPDVFLESFRKKARIALDALLGE